MSESEFTKFKNFQNENQTMNEFDFIIMILFWKFSNSENSDSDKKGSDYDYISKRRKCTIPPPSPATMMPSGATAQHSTLASRLRDASCKPVVKSQTLRV